MFSRSVPANVRQRFLGSGLKVVGEDHPAAAAATKSLDYYRELLDEIQLRVAIDGPTRVGHSQPFGVFIGLEATRQLQRESGGFGKYIQNRANQQQVMMGGGGGGGRTSVKTSPKTSTPLLMKPSRSSPSPSMTAP